MHIPMVMKYPGLFLIFFVSVAVHAQNVFQVELQNSTLVSTDSLLPFWHTANRHGRIESSHSVLNVTGISLEQFHSRQTTAPVSYTWGAEVIAGWGESSYYQVNRAFGGVAFKGWEFKAGMFYEPEKFNGLSVTNGNLARSRNARPYPMIRLSTKQFKPVPFTQNLVSFKAEYDEGVLNDNRFVKNARLHHKAFYLRFSPASDWKITGGFEHFVFWGGISSNERIGKMPSDFKAYIRYIMGSGGSEDFPQTDQANKAGNQLGTYQLEVQKSFSKAEVTLFLSHPFEDLSGVNWRNWPDNLAGLYVNFTGDPPLVTGLLYEYTSTWQQSIRGDWDRQEPDNYFNHSIYRSGYTYHGRMLGAPLFQPDISEEGVVTRIASNRFFAHNLGITGKCKALWRWKGLLTYSEHAGTIGNPYNRNIKQISGLAEVQYVRAGFPVEIGFSLAADAGSNNYRNVGAMLSVTKKW
jgi:hypothetical protein